MPQWVDNCVRKLLADKNFKGTEADAWAICTAQYNKQKGENMGEKRELEKKEPEVERLEKEVETPYEKVIFREENDNE